MALALSAVSRDAFRFDLLPTVSESPLSGPTRTIVETFADIFSARLDSFGADSNALVFSPSRDDTQQSDFHVQLDPPGSVVELLMLLLPALLLRDRSTRLYMEGGTHVPGAMLPEQVSATVESLVEDVGGRLDVELIDYGFPPRGDGALRAEIEPIRGRPEAPDWRERGRVEELEVTVVLAHLQRHIAEREIDGLVEARPDGLPLGAKIVELHDAPSQGNALIVEVRASRMVETLGILGERGVQAETIAERCAEPLLTYLSSDAAFQATTPVASLLSAPAGAGRISAAHLDAATSAFIELAPDFLRSDIRVHELDDDHHDIHLESNVL
jgi:RNA 3'-terminal phosphate cyclase (ATP)